jgi:hypothetical protein
MSGHCIITLSFMNVKAGFDEFYADFLCKIKHLRVVFQVLFKRRGRSPVPPPFGLRGGTAVRTFPLPWLVQAEIRAQ